MIHFKIVTPENITYQDTIDSLTLETVSGEITILGNHMPLVSVLRPGEMTIRKGSEEIIMAVSGGFVEVEAGSTVSIIADSADRAEEIDEKKAEEARRRAEEILAKRTTETEIAGAESSLARSLAQLKVARKKKRRA